MRRSVDSSVVMDLTIGVRGRSQYRGARCFLSQRTVDGCGGAHTRGVRNRFVSLAGRATFEHVTTATKPDRRAAICDAVFELLGEVGYDRMTMDAVAARARASKATIYRGWPSKPELVMEAVEHRFGGAIGAPRHRLAARRPARPAHRRVRGGQRGGRRRVHRAAHGGHAPRGAGRGHVPLRVPTSTRCTSRCSGARGGARRGAPTPPLNCCTRCCTHGHEPAHVAERAAGRGVRGPARRLAY